MAYSLTHWLGSTYRPAELDKQLCRPRIIPLERLEESLFCGGRAFMAYSLTHWLGSTYRPAELSKQLRRPRIIPPERLVSFK